MHKRFNTEASFLQWLNDQGYHLEAGKIEHWSENGTISDRGNRDISECRNWQ